MNQKRCLNCFTKRKLLDAYVSAYLVCRYLYAYEVFLRVPDVSQQNTMLPFIIIKKKIPRYFSKHSNS